MKKIIQVQALCSLNNTEYLIFCALFLCGTGLLYESLSSEESEDDRFLLRALDFWEPLALRLLADLGGWLLK